LFIKISDETIKISDETIKMKVKKEKTFAIYFLTDDSKKRSYIGFTVGQAYERFRKHALKLKASARCTKNFTGCHLWATITGIPTKSKGLSMEWHAKRRKSHVEILVLPKECPHKRLSTFLASLKHDKFKDLCSELTVNVRDTDQLWSSNISSYYNVAVQQLEPPFCVEHFKKKVDVCR
jgi:hypothetical protein